MGRVTLYFARRKGFPAPNLALPKRRNKERNTRFLRTVYIKTAFFRQRTFQDVPPFANTECLVETRPTPSTAWRWIVSRRIRNKNAGGKNAENLCNPTTVSVLQKKLPYVIMMMRYIRLDRNSSRRKTEYEQNATKHGTYNQNSKNGCHCNARSPRCSRLRQAG